MQRFSERLLVELTDRLTAQRVWFSEDIQIVLAATAFALSDELVRDIEGARCDSICLLFAEPVDYLGLRLASRMVHRISSLDVIGMLPLGPSYLVLQSTLVGKVAKRVG